MKTHLIWSVVTVVTAAAWGKWVLYSRDAEVVRLDRVVVAPRVEPAAALTPVVVPSEAPASAPSPASVSTVPAPEYAIQRKDQLSLDEIRRLLQSGTADDAWSAYSAISQMVPSPLKIELLRELLKCREAQIRQNALYQVLNTFGREAAEPLFREHLRSDPAAIVREAAAQLLGGSDIPGAFEALLEAFQKDELRVQVAAAGSLVGFDHPGPAAEVAQRLAPMLDHQDSAVRRKAVEMLAGLSTPAAIPMLARALRDSSGDVRMQAVNSFYAIEDARRLSLVEPLLQDPVEDVRDSAKQLIESLKGK
jgi:HEAT repeat protein